MAESLNWVISAHLAPTNDVAFFAATLQGTLDGVNSVFTLQPAPVNGAMIFWNGMLLTPGTQNTDPPGQYILAGAMVLFQPQAVPQPGVKLQGFVW
jgi:hypothetical protein